MGGGRHVERVRCGREPETMNGLLHYLSVPSSSGSIDGVRNAPSIGKTSGRSAHDAPALARAFHTHLKHVAMRALDDARAEKVR